MLAGFAILGFAGCATITGASAAKSVPVLSDVRLSAVRSTASCSQGGDDITFEGMQSLQSEAAKAKADALVIVSCGVGTATSTCAQTYVCRGDAIRFGENVANTAAPGTSAVEG